MEAIDRPGTLLDVGCAKGLLMESIAGHVRLEIGSLERVLDFGRRMIVSSDGSFRRPESPRAEPVADGLRDLGLEFAGALYRRSDEHQVEIAVAWVDPLASPDA